MGSYFHVIERKVGGNLDAFRRELGRLRESGHFHRDRHERIMRIAQTVGFGHIVRQCLVDTGHRAGCEVHVLTSTGIVLVFNAHSCKLVTVLVARPGQVARYYEPFGEDGVPFCWDYQIKGFFKDACSALRRVPGTRSSKLTAFKKVIDGTVFVEQRRIPFQLPDGAECGRCERPLRASSASGERVALAASETVPAGTVLEFSVLVMNPKDAETVREWLDYGRLRGLFQWRNSGKGRFEWEEVARD